MALYLHQRIKRHNQTIFKVNLKCCFPTFEQAEGRDDVYFRVNAPLIPLNSSPGKINRAWSIRRSGRYRSEGEITVMGTHGKTAWIPETDVRELNKHDFKEGKTPD